MTQFQDLPKLKTGKKPATHNPKDLQLAHFERLGATISPAPIGFGPYTKLPHNGWGMLGNDEYGDCEWAESAHCVMALNKLVGKSVDFTRENVLSDYASTGFDINAGPPGDNPTDQGTDMHQSMSYRRHTGVIDAHNTRHKIGAYLSLEPGNWLQLLEALHVFETISIGFAFPNTAMGQFNKGLPWSVVAGAPAPTEGHAVNVVGRPKQNMIYVVTWGRIQLMTRAFYIKYADEAYAFVSVEDLANGKSPTGYNMSELSNILNSL